MNRGIVGLAATLSVAVFAAACDQAPPTSPQVEGPSFGQAASPFACVFTGNPSLSNAANAYFTSTADKRAAGAIIDRIQTAFGNNKNYTNARGPGFELLALTADKAHAGFGSSTAAGTTLLRQTIQCMFDVAGADASKFVGWPTAPQFDFAAAQDFDNGGTLDVRTVANTTDDAVVAEDGDGPVSGVLPKAAATWASTLSNTVLIYGNPVVGGYDWKLIPNTTTFTPYVVVALCRADATSEMVHQAGVGVIGYEGARAAEVCNASLNQGPLGRLTQFAARLFAPTPAQAAVLGFSTIGGSASSAKGDEFKFLPLPNVTLTVTQQPTNVKVNTRFSLTINVKTPAPANEPAGGITVGLGSFNNNGTPTGIFQVGPNVPARFVCETSTPGITVPSATTLPTVAAPGASPAPTNAVWNNNLCFSKTGGVAIVATSKASGNETEGEGTATSAKINVKP